VIGIPTSPAAHYAFDALAWVGATAAAIWQHRKWPDGARRLSAITAPSYFVSLGVVLAFGGRTLIRRAREERGNADDIADTFK
jgi:hypothetical protein